MEDDDATKTGDNHMKHVASGKVTDLFEKELLILHKELDLVQDVVNRMSKMTFLIKGWAISVLTLGISIKVGLVGKSGLTWYSYVSGLFFLLPLLAFWYLDSYYFQLEHAFRTKYKDVLNKRIVHKDWSEPYRLNRRCFVVQWYSIPRIMISRDEIPFYGSMLIMIGIAAFILA